MKRKLVLLLLLLSILLMSGCSVLNKYKMIGTWSGKFQVNIATITITSETNGTISFGGGYPYSLACRKIDDSSFEASYGWNSDYGWQSRKIVAYFVNKNEFVATLYNQYETNIGNGVFVRQ